MFVHGSVKEEEADALLQLTARHTDAVYKVSGQDKRLMWRLGGRKSDFVMEGIHIIGPHDARFIRRDGDTEYITLLDNGGDEERSIAATSTAYLLALDQSRTPWTARVVKKWSR